MIYHAKTNGILVKVQPEFLESESDPLRDHYAWGYHVRIENENGTAVQLLRRKWEIIDSNGHSRHVEGEGVVGVKPVIPASAFFEYNSGAALKTPSGIMRGTYLIEDENGDEFEIQIPAFSLDSQYETAVLQ